MSQTTAAGPPPATPGAPATNPTTDPGRPAQSGRRSRRLVRLVAAGALGAVLAGCSSGSGPARPRSSTTTSSLPTTTTSPASTTTTAPAGPVGGPVPAGFVPESVTFVSPTTGWVLGSAPCAKAPCTSLLRTRDGGATWKGIPAPPTSLGPGGQGAVGVSTLRFADPLDGWAFGPELWSTHNGGSTWKRVSLPGGAGGPPSVRALEAGEGTAYALAIPGDAQSTSGTAQVYRTGAGSDAWAAVPGTTVPDATEGTLLAQGGAAWAVLVTSGGKGVFLAGGSGGWAARRLPCDLPSLSVAAATASDMAAVCASGAGAGQQPKQAYVSSDGGVTWRAAGSGPLGGDTLGVAMASPSTIVISAASGASWLYGSFDGGRTWASVLEDTASGGLPWRDLGFTTPTQGVVVEGSPAVSPGPGSSRLYMTRDGGHTWSVVPLR